MPNDPLIWIILILAVALIVALALWKGRGLRVSKDRDGFSVEVERSSEGNTGGESKGTTDGIRVAEGARIKESRVGDIAGVKTLSAAPAVDKDIEVASGVRINKAEVGDIVGDKQSDARKENDG